MMHTIKEYENRRMTFDDKAFWAFWVVDYIISNKWSNPNLFYSYTTFIFEKIAEKNMCF